jgi:FtsH-binding integral membrane protein
MPKWYTKTSWAVNGVIIGLIIAGLVNRSFTSLVLGAVIGLLTAIIFKAAAWFRQRQSGP